MVFFAHVGITLGAAVVLNRLMVRPWDTALVRGNAASVKPVALWRSAEAWFLSVGQRFDLRWLLLGSMVSDMIDKPAGFLFYGTFGCRLFCHSLVFLVLVSLAGICLYLSRRKSWAIVLAFGILIHLALDEMWLDTQTFLWPTQGFSFPTVVRSEWAEGVLHRLLTSPKIYLPELLGLMVLAYLAWLLARRSTIRAFITRGQI